MIGEWQMFLIGLCIGALLMLLSFYIMPDEWHREIKNLKRSDEEARLQEQADRCFIEQAMEAEGIRSDDDAEEGTSNA